MTYLSAGDELVVDAEQEIKWNATDNVDVVSRAIYLTTDGSSWELVDSAS